MILIFDDWLFFSTDIGKSLPFHKKNVSTVKKRKIIFFKIFSFHKLNYFRRLEAATGLSTDNKEEPFMIGTLYFIREKP